MFGIKRRQRLERLFGRTPDVYYSDNAMKYIRAYFDYRREREPEAYCVDEITWYDLDMDEIFVRLNQGLSTPGEQVLYDTLRHPATEREDFEARRRLIEAMESDPRARLHIQVILDELGRTRRADLCTAFQPKYRGKALLALYVGLLAALVTLAVLAALKVISVLPAILLFVFNTGLREFSLRRIQRDFDTVNYSAREVRTLHRIRKLRVPAIDRECGDAYEALDRLKLIRRMGGIASTGTGDMGDLLLTVLMLDLITYELLKSQLWSKQKELMAVFLALGRLDTAIAAASWRKSIQRFAVPELTFGGERVFLAATDLMHPLLEDAVPNDLVTEKSILLTGSNASGKSTYLRTVLLNALLAQSICTALASKYEGSAFYLYSSMALSDDLAAGESYYVTEIRSVRRILEAVKRRRPVLCAVDEVLRGTNTVERIAASSTILDILFRSEMLCLAATHDGELCEMLKDQCHLFHFQETVEDGEMAFDYRLHPGPARSRNAIRLLEIMGFDESLVEEAEERALRYLETGQWTAEKPCL